MVLTTWTALCMLYSWWMLRVSPWHGLTCVEKPAVTALATAEPRTTEGPESVVEGLVTLTLRRVLGRLKIAQDRSDYGRIMKYSQGKKWLCAMLTHLPGSMLERNRTVESLTGEKELSSDD